MEARINPSRKSAYWTGTEILPLACGVASHQADSSVSFGHLLCDGPGRRRFRSLLSVAGHDKLSGQAPQGRVTASPEVEEEGSHDLPISDAALRA